jgi:hypothetical protein
MPEQPSVSSTREPTREVIALRARKVQRGSPKKKVMPRDMQSDFYGERIGSKKRSKTYFSRKCLKYALS